MSKKRGAAAGAGAAAGGAAKKAKGGKTDDLHLDALFADGHGDAWQEPLGALLAAQPESARFIGPKRDKSILPLRELTFQALKPNLPAAWKVLVFGQNPYPRVESATGIAMFDNLIDGWESKQFGKSVSMRCITKTAAMWHDPAAIGEKTPIGELRAALKRWGTVSPEEWFQAMLTQGVLLLNAALTVGGADLSKTAHTNFWKPVVAGVVDEILRAKAASKDAADRHLVLLWWGGESKKTKKALQHVFAKHAGSVNIVHIEHCNPAAQGDLFCKAPNHFHDVNAALTAAGQTAINWLPDKPWLAGNGTSAHGAFITATKELHKLYLDRMQNGLEMTSEMAPIETIFSHNDALPLSQACKPIGLAKAAEQAVRVSSTKVEQNLDDDEKGAIFLYTGNELYRRINEALRNPDRSQIVPYFKYLRVFLGAFDKLVKKKTTLYRGIFKDLAKEYAQGSTITWWSVSSCTPNIDVARQFGGGAPGGTLFLIQAATAVPIMHLSAYQGEEEFVLAPGTQLEVVSVKKPKGGATEIRLKEVAGKRLVR
jgi:uracil DNA glycosylase